MKEEVIITAECRQLDNAQMALNIAEQIADNTPELKDLTGEQLEALGKAVLYQRLKDKMETAVNIAGIDYNQEKGRFLNDSLRSAQTKRGYKAALDRLEQWTATNNLKPLELTPAQADDYIYSLNKEGRAPASIRRDVAGASSFYTFLERRHQEVKNPFRGTKARPKKETVKKGIYPTASELQTVLDNVPEEMRAVISVLAYRGLRAGALPGLRIWGERFTSKSKGKEVQGTLPPEALEAIGRAGLDKAQPFKQYTTEQIEHHVFYYTEKLEKEGKIPDAYSAHDFRHFFAVTEYRKDKDIYRVSKLLNHASIQVTELYLRGLNVLD